jgi:hypothetical protein
LEDGGVIGLVFGVVEIALDVLSDKLGVRKEPGVGKALLAPIIDLSQFQIGNGAQFPVGVGSSNLLLVGDKGVSTEAESEGNEEKKEYKFPSKALGCRITEGRPQSWEMEWMEGFQVQENLQFAIFRPPLNPELAR